MRSKSRYWLGVASVPFAGMIAGACVTGGDGEGSETHFVCQVDADCSDRPGTVCVGGECVSADASPGAGGGPALTNVFVDTISQKNVDKVDLLFVIDNSTSMADKQAVLRDAVPDLVKRFVSPRCVDPTTGLPSGDTPDDPEAACAGAAYREHDPVRDIHVGVITSSLGGFGSPACSPRSGASSRRLEMENDRAELVGSRPRFASASTPGAEAPAAEGFLAWNRIANPGQQIVPFVTAFQDMTAAAGDLGCDYEAPLESLYRFLVDPAPPSSVELVACPHDPLLSCVTPGPINAALLAQRQAFLRPDSLLAIVLVSDENDCSVRDSGEYLGVLDPGVALRSSSVCATDPNDPCCYSCSRPAPDGCEADPVCTLADNPPSPPSLALLRPKAPLRHRPPPSHGALRERADPERHLPGGRRPGLREGRHARLESALRERERPRA